MSHEINLSEGQKKVLIGLRDNIYKFSWDRFFSKFYFNGKTFQYNKGCQLRTMGLIERDKTILGSLDVYYYKLTDLGKQIAQSL